VDDNATNCLILEEMLHNWRMQPQTLTKSTEALDVMRARQRTGDGFELVIIDANMPGMNGFDLAAAIKDDPELGSAITMMLTSSGWREVARCEQLGIAAFMTKPVKQSELFDIIAKAIGADVESQPRTAPQVADSASQLRPLNILLAEDSVVNQKLALAQLEQHGHQVFVVNNGKEAVKKWESQPFDLILMDIQMPEMDGLAATQLIRERERQTGAHVPIVAMTAHAMKGDREHCLEAGMDAYVPKPIRAKDLLTTLERLFSAPPSAAPATGLDGRRPAVPDSNVAKEPAAPISNVVVESAPADVLDWDAAQQQNGVGTDVFREMAALFLDESAKLLVETREAITRGDVIALRRAAHTLKGSAAVFAALPATAASLRLETIAKEDRLNEAEAACADVEREIQRLRLALVARLGTAGTEGVKP
jgi:two-component system, sensor histidine kinase and response regulator